MAGADRRKELREQYEERGPEAGVYRIVNRRTGRVLIGSAMNLASVEAKLSFARKVGGNGGLDHRLYKDIAEFGIDAFEFEVLDVVQRTGEMTPEEMKRELAALEKLWREEAGEGALY